MHNCLHTIIYNIKILAYKKYLWYYQLIAVKKSGEVNKWHHYHAVKPICVCLRALL